MADHWLVRAPGPGIAWLVSSGSDETVGDPALAGRFDETDAARIAAGRVQRFGSGWRAEPFGDT